MLVVENWAVSMGYADNLYRIYEFTRLFSWKYMKLDLKISENILSYFKTASNSRAIMLHNSRGK